MKIEQVVALLNESQLMPNELLLPGSNGVCSLSESMRLELIKNGLIGITSPKEGYSLTREGRELVENIESVAYEYNRLAAKRRNVERFALRIKNVWNLAIERFKFKI